jgi:soluble lytic murein transglycosylase
VLYRHIPVLILILLCTISVSRASLFPTEDEALRLSAERLKNKEYTAALSAALKAQPSQKRDFVLGVTAYHLEKWNEAEVYLAAAADCFPLLGDFALYYRAIALTHLSRPAEALLLLENIRKEYPESPFARSATLLIADTLFQGEDYRRALTAYQAFRSEYPSGNDSLKALYHSALCREKLGDREGAAGELREIWLAYPTKSIAGQAESELERLRKVTDSVPPYTPEELFRRGCTLFDQRHYRQAEDVFSSLSPDTLSEKLRGALAFKIAMTQYRLKKNSAAKDSFARLASSASPYPEYAVESSYWLAQIHDRIGENAEAVHRFLEFATAHPESPLADNALFYAALIRKHEGSHRDALELFRKILAEYPASSHAPRSLWESAWSLYLSGDFAQSAKTFALLSNDSAWREKALYWQGRALGHSGSEAAARSVYAVVQREFPAGYYALNIEKETGTRHTRIPHLEASFHASLPEPPGMERAQTLIALGLHEEARKELAAVKRRNGSSFKGSLAHAGLYLAMNDYRSAMGLFKMEALSRDNGNLPYAWAILYPAGFNDIVARHTANMGIDESLTYALIRAESSFSPTVRSPVGALGLMQLMPATAKDTAKGMGESVSTFQLTNPEVNVRIGTRHLRDLINRFNGNLVSAVAAYNAGSTPVTRWRKNFPTLREDEFIENIPYAETREYVKKVLAAREVYRRLYDLKDSPGLTAPSSSLQQKFTSAATSGPAPMASSAN